MDSLTLQQEQLNKFLKGLGYKKGVIQLEVRKEERPYNKNQQDMCARLA